MQPAHLLRGIATKGPRPLPGVEDIHLTSGEPSSRTPGGERLPRMQRVHSLAMRTLGLLVVGDEILAGEVRDLNGPYLLDRARALGLPVVMVVTVPDDAEAVAEALELLCARAGTVIVSGGIGPTHDDVTRQAVAAVLGVGLERHAEAARRLRGFYGEEATAADLSMADLPVGAELVEGLRTSAFGFSCGEFVVLPGVPSLYADLVDGLAASWGGSPLARAEVVTPHREGEIAPVLTRVQDEAPDVSIGSYPELEAGRWHVRVVVRGADPERVEAIRAQLAGELARALDDGRPGTRRS